MPPLAKKQQSYWTIKNAYSIGKRCLTDRSTIWVLCSLLIVFEILLNIVVILKVKYTEIDWTAYMEEVEGFLNGTLNYTKLKGGTGPLVYPAGFVYLFSGLYYLTDHGANIRLGQYIFLLFYIFNLILVARIYKKSTVIPPYVLLFICCMSYRIHSIYVLRLFNDPVAMLFLYAAVNLFINKKWALGCVLFSLGVSIKMNILLFAPGLLVCLLYEKGISKTIINLLICFVIQVVLGLPFLLNNPKGYLIMSFDLGRQFFYIWTVNWRLIPESIFLDKRFQIALLTCHLTMLFLFAYKKWFKKPDNLFQLINFNKYWSSPVGTLTELRIILILFTSNFIGMCFSRSLHYQFYVWYYHTLPVLLWALPISTKFRVLLLGIIEFAWNSYPSTVFSSASLHACHAVILFLLWVGPVWQSVYIKPKAE